MQYSIVNCKDLESTSFRLDAEYYRPIFLQAEKHIKCKDWDYLENLSESIKSFGAYSLCNQVEYIEKGIPFLRCKDIKSGRIDFSDVLYISHDANKLLWKSEVTPNTVLFTMSGTVGNSTIATEDIEYPINSNQDIAKIRTNDLLNPYFFSVFLQSGYGEKQISRLPVGSVQQHIFLWQLEKLIVPSFRAQFQRYIEHVFRLSLSYLKKSDGLYNQIQSLLLSELGLSNWQPKHQLSFVRNYSDTDKAGRINADYFQPKYDEIVKAIKSYHGGWDTLGNIVSVKKSIEVGSDAYMDEGDVPFVRVSNLSPFEITEEKYISNELYAELSQHQPKQGEILLSKDGTPGIAYHNKRKAEEDDSVGRDIALTAKEQKDQRRLSDACTQLHDRSGANQQGRWRLYYSALESGTD